MPSEPLTPPLVGRPREFEYALDTLRSGRSVVVTGPPGAGRTRFAAAVTSALRSDGDATFAFVADGHPPLPAEIATPVRSLNELAAARNGTDAAQKRFIVVLHDGGDLVVEVVDRLLQEARARRITVLATTPLRSPNDSGGPVTDRLMRLWLDGHAGRVDLGALNAADSLQLIRSAADAAVLDGETEARIVRDGAGLPLLILELTKTALEEDTSTARPSSLFRSRSRPNQRILDLVRPRIEGVPDEVLRSLVTASRLEGTRQPGLARRLSRGALESLIAADLAWVEPTTGRVWVRRLEAEAAFSQVGPPDLTDIRRGMLADLRTGYPLDTAELVVLGEETDVDELDDADRRLLADAQLAAAREAYFRGQSPLAFDLARTSAEAGHPEGSDELARAKAALSGPLAPYSKVDHLVELVDRMRWSEIPERVEELLAGEENVLRRLEALGPLVLASAALGRSADIDNAVESGQALIASLATDPHFRDSAESVAVITEFIAYTAFARVVTGERWSEVESVLERITSELLAGDYHGLLPVIAVARGLVAFGRGRGQLAEAEFRRALPGHPGWSPFSKTWVRALLARSAAKAGRMKDAMLWSGLAHTAPVSEWDRYALVHLDGDLLEARGEAVEAADVFAAEAFRQAESSPTFTVVTGFEAVRLGRAEPELLNLIDTAASSSDLEVLTSMAEAAHALISSDERQLARARFSAGSKGRTLLSQELGGAPAEGVDGAAADAAALTAREREVAALAGRGLSNAAIAARLYLSVRTVESHLYSARLKTGAVTRRELGDAAVTPG